MVVAAARDHCTDICDNLVRSKQCSIHPPTSLLHQHRQTSWSVSESLGIWDVLHGIASVLLDVYLEAHDSIFSKILVGLSAGRGLRAGHIFEESI
jgi:hypothetical protein